MEEVVIVYKDAKSATMYTDMNPDELLPLLNDCSFVKMFYFSDGVKRTTLLNASDVSSVDFENY
ncbi:hypothetical protein COK06_13265 [Bacillus cereus]|nr:hypothetical protein COK06_13265 [Bacillus cereus]